jgi:hypothetical protein
MRALIESLLCARPSAQCKDVLICRGAPAVASACATSLAALAPSDAVGHIDADVTCTAGLEQ